MQYKEILNKQIERFHNKDDETKVLIIEKFIKKYSSIEYFNKLKERGVYDEGYDFYYFLFEYGLVYGTHMNMSDEEMDDFMVAKFKILNNYEITLFNGCGSFVCVKKIE